MQKPRLSSFQLWNMSFGFIGLQVAMSLQTSNTSRILSALGADPNQLPLFWVVAPIIGMILQPIVGSQSDNTWTRFGRRIPYIFVGGILSTIALLILPNSELMTQWVPPLVFGTSILLLFYFALNIAMQPFRSLVGDIAPKDQQNEGFSMQAITMGIGALIGSILPALLTVCGIRNAPEMGERVAPSVILAFYVGAAILLPTILWTCFRVKEYSPIEVARFDDKEKENTDEKLSLKSILKSTPKTMYQLAIVQFFAWFAAFITWVYSTNAFAENIWHTTDSLSEEYNMAGNWYGVLSAIQSVSSIIFALFIVKLSNRWSKKIVLALTQLIGAISLFSIQLIENKYGLIIPMIGYGIAWAGIITLPFSILSNSIPAKRMGLFMGLFNITITVPQIVAGFTGGFVFKYIAGNSVGMITVGGVCLLLATISVFIVDDKKEKVEEQ